MRGATIKRPQKSLKEVISIHAPHAGSDCLELQQPEIYKYFNPRSPCGERQEGQMNETDLMHISIHAPHAGSDRFRLAGAGGFHDFNPRSPCGERLLRCLQYPSLS